GAPARSTSGGGDVADPLAAALRARPLPRQRGGRGRVLVGFVLGALCGYAVYWTGALLAGAEDLARAPVETLPDQFLRPIRVFTAWEGALMLTAATLGAMVARYRWRIAGLLSYVSMISLIAGYLAYSLTVTLPKVPEQERWLSYILLAAEAGGLSLIVVFSFYSLDASARRRWARSAAERPYDPRLRPKVAFEVPVFNEPFEMVQQTILHLLRQDYPRERFLVAVVDDSTDAALASRLAAFCAEVGADYVRRPDRRGFKAGALNHATRLLPADFELVAVIDADYWVDPDFLKHTVGYFVDPSLSFVQTPQDYRNVGESFLTRRYKRAEAYFYHAIMPSRNEQSAIIFCGTMGILRRRALEEIGGFAEDQICEDAEVSVRLACAGWDSLYVDRTYGRGLMPAVFDAYKKQFHRWAFGNVRILFTRMGMILRSRMTRRQKFDFLVSNLHWFDGLFVVTIAGVLLYLGLGPLLGYDAVTHHQRELTLLALVPVFLLCDGLLRLHIVLRRAGHSRIRDAVLIQGMWFAIKFTNMWAAVKCLLGFRTPFVRTPKEPGRRLGRFRSFFRSLRITKVESLLGLTLLAVAGLNAQRLVEEPPAEWGTYLLPVWLALYALFFLCAPLYAYLSYRTLRPGHSHAVAPAPARAGPA
ncbi:MAG TPA: glycosyltransferase, partial [Candidatus Thermoplasmatota archaeon]|nr:glycosyltransferase [Candidatus Thermoplasmatota archaeon]